MATRKKQSFEQQLAQVEALISRMEEGGLSLEESVQRYEEGLTMLAALEKELLTLVNETGIGPQGLGGLTTCLGLHIVAGPTHIAGLPVAVNVSCHVTRHQSAVL